MYAIHVDSTLDDDARRERLYDGDLFVYSPRPSTQALVEFAAAMAEEAFGSLEPETAQYEMPVENYAALLADLKPRFIHHPESKRLIIEMLIDFGCDPEKVHFDVPRMRTSTAQGYLTTGIAYAFHPHRDTWYSAPSCQLNWWLPIYPITTENGLAFHPRYWYTPCQKQLEGVQLRRVECHKSQDRGEPNRCRYTDSAKARRGRGVGSSDPPAL